jgi:hypothetical protein
VRMSLQARAAAQARMPVAMRNGDGMVSAPEWN